MLTKHCSNGGVGRVRKKKDQRVRGSRERPDTRDRPGRRGSRPSTHSGATGKSNIMKVYVVVVVVVVVVIFLYVFRGKHFETCYGPEA